MNDDEDEEEDDEDGGGCCLCSTTGLATALPGVPRRRRLAIPNYMMASYGWPQSLNLFLLRAMSSGGGPAVSGAGRVRPQVARAPVSDELRRELLSMRHLCVEDQSLSGRKKFRMFRFCPCPCGQELESSALVWHIDRVLARGVRLPRAASVVETAERQAGHLDSFADSFGGMLDQADESEDPLPESDVLCDPVNASDADASESDDDVDTIFNRLRSALSPADLLLLSSDIDRAANSNSERFPSGTAFGGGLQLFPLHSSRCFKREFFQNLVDQSNGGLLSWARPLDAALLPLFAFWEIIEEMHLSQSVSQRLLSLPCAFREPSCSTPRSTSNLLQQYLPSFGFKMLDACTRGCCIFALELQDKDACPNCGSPRRDAAMEPVRSVLYRSVVESLCSLFMSQPLRELICSSARRPDILSLGNSLCAVQDWRFRTGQFRPPPGKCINSSGHVVVRDLIDSTEMSQFSQSGEPSSSVPTITFHFSVFQDGIVKNHCRNNSVSSCLVTLLDLPPHIRHQLPFVFFPFSSYKNRSERLCRAIDMSGAVCRLIAREIEQANQVVHAVRLASGEMYRVRFRVLFGSADMRALSALTGAQVQQSGKLCCPLCFLNGVYSAISNSTVYFGHGRVMERLRESPSRPFSLLSRVDGVLRRLQVRPAVRDAKFDKRLAELLEDFVSIPQRRSLRPTSAADHSIAGAVAETVFPELMHVLSNNVKLLLSLLHLSDSGVNVAHLKAVFEEHGKSAYPAPCLGDATSALMNLRAAAGESNQAAVAAYGVSSVSGGEGALVPALFALNPDQRKSMQQRLSSVRFPCSVTRPQLQDDSSMSSLTCSELLAFATPAFMWAVHPYFFYSLSSRVASAFFRVDAQPPKPDVLGHFWKVFGECEWQDLASSQASSAISTAVKPYVVGVLLRLVLSVLFVVQSSSWANTPGLEEAFAHQIEVIQLAMSLIMPINYNTQVFHSIRHLPQLLRRFGPLRGIWSAYAETRLRDVRDASHGFRNVPLETMSRFFSLWQMRARRLHEDLSVNIGTIPQCRLDDDSKDRRSPRSFEVPGICVSFVAIKPSASTRSRSRACPPLTWQALKDENPQRFALELHGQSHSPAMMRSVLELFLSKTPSRTDSLWPNAFVESLVDCRLLWADKDYHLSDAQLLVLMESCRRGWTRLQQMWEGTLDADEEPVPNSAYHVRKGLPAWKPLSGKQLQRRHALFQERVQQSTSLGLSFLPLARRVSSASLNGIEFRCFDQRSAYDNSVVRVRFVDDDDQKNEWSAFAVIADLFHVVLWAADPPAYRPQNCKASPSTSCDCSFCTLSDGATSEGALFAHLGHDLSACGPSDHCSPLDKDLRFLLKALSGSSAVVARIRWLLAPPRSSYESAAHSMQTQTPTPEAASLSFADGRFTFSAIVWRPYADCYNDSADEFLVLQHVERCNYVLMPAPIDSSLLIRAQRLAMKRAAAAISREAKRQRKELPQRGSIPADDDGYEQQIESGSSSDSVLQEDDDAPEIPAPIDAPAAGSVASAAAAGSEPKRRPSRVSRIPQRLRDDPDSPPPHRSSGENQGARLAPKKFDHSGGCPVKDLIYKSLISAEPSDQFGPTAVCIAAATYPDERSLHLLHE